MKLRFLLGGVLLLACCLSVRPARSQQEADRARELERASSLNAQVVKLSEEKKFDEALPIAQTVLEIRQRLLAANDPLIAGALINLGELYLATKKDSEAEKTLQLALKTVETAENPVATSRVLDSLAFLRIRKHDFARADPLLLRSLTIKERVWGADNPQTIEAMKDYACLEIRNRKREDMLSKDNETESARLRGRAFCWLSELSADCSPKPHLQTRDVLNGKALRLVTPPYPPEARAKHLSGSAYIAVLIDTEGNVAQARSVCGGYAELNHVSVDAARRSKFAPTKIDGEPVQVTGLIVYSFITQ